MLLPKLLLAKFVQIRYNFVGGNMKVKDNFILKKIAGSYVVIPVRSAAVDFSGIIKLTESGAFLWELLGKDVGRDDLIHALLDEYEVDQETAAADVDRFIEKLREADLIE